MSTPTLIRTSRATSALGAREALEHLRRRPDVVVLTPEDAGFDAARHAWNAAVSHQPDVVALPTSALGVAAVVRYAREQRQSLAIQATGHGPTRTVTSGVLVNLSRLNEVSVDPVARTATIHGGAKWQALLEVAAPLGLTPLLGSTPDVSAIGYTLGGGLGWLGRKYGTAADSVLEFDLVTATGQLVTVTAESDPDLFWALRGAGAGHLGVVTRMVIELYPISELYAGNLIYPGSMAADVLRRWRDWLPSLPEALTSAVTLLNYPDIDEIPEAFRGKPFVHVRGAFDGPADAGAALMDYWRSWREPVADMWGPLPIARIAEVSDDPLDPVPYAGTGVWLSGLSDATIDELVTVMAPDASPQLVQAELRHYGGAVATVPVVPSSFGNRDALILLELVGITPTDAEVRAVDALVDAFKPRIADDLTGGHYLNYVEGQTRRHGVEAGIAPGTLGRLAAVKARLDPRDLFDHGLSVPR